MLRSSPKSSSNFALFLLAVATTTYIATSSAFCAPPMSRRQTRHDFSVQSVGNPSELETKVAMARHTILTIAASVMSLPSEVFTTPPMVEPPPSCEDERAHRQAVSQVLERCWSYRAGFEIPQADELLVDGTATAATAQTDQHYPSTYGEVTELGARQLFHYMKMKHGQNVNFMDLGSGAGKLVAQAYMEIPELRLAVGIELAHARHAIAVQAWNVLKGTGIVDQVRTAMETCHHEASSVELRRGDLFDADISEATHIYIASLCFTDDMMERVAEKLVCEATALQCVATLKEFPKRYEEQLGKSTTEFVEMSWTMPRGCSVFFYRPPPQH